MKETQPSEKLDEVNEYRSDGAHPPAYDEVRRTDDAGDYRDFIARWRRAILRAATVPAVLKRTLYQLSDHELAIYLAVKCRGGKLDRSVS